MPKLTLQLTPEMDELIEQLAASRGIPKSQALRRAVLIMKYLDDGVADNKDILLRDKTDGSTEKIVLESQI